MNMDINTYHMDKGKHLKCIKEKRHTLINLSKVIFTKQGTKSMKVAIKKFNLMVLNSDSNN